LKRKDNTIYFEHEDGVKKPIPVEQTSSIHFFGSVDFNTALLHLLSKYQICFHVYNYYGFYDGTFSPRKARVSGHCIVQQCAHVLDADKRIYLARCFVQAGLHHMIRNLRKSNNQDVAPYVNTLESLSANVHEASDIPTLMGVEGSCRKVYYEAFGRLIKNGMTFHERSKQPPLDPVNAMISFGNSLMYTSILSEFYKTVIDPSVSFLHEPSRKRFSLCLDVAEIFKPLIVDSLILTLLNNRRIRSEHFESKDGAVYLNDDGRRRFLDAYEEKLNTTIKHRKLNRNVSYRFLLRLEAYKLIKHFIGDEIYKPMKAWW